MYFINLCFYKAISPLFHTFSYWWDSQETFKFVRPDKLWKRTSGVILILVFSSM